jgi:Ca2+-binding EF-hand superfamily protein
MEEMLAIVTTIYDMEGAPKEMAGARAETIFRALDVNGDGVLDEEEFCQ